MVWLALTLGGVGAALGFWLFRVHLIVAGSVLSALFCMAMVPVAQWAPLQSIVYAIALTAALQSGYLAGVVLLSMSSRVKRAADQAVEPGHPIVPG